jgi:hypothetical protein
MGLDKAREMISSMDNLEAYLIYGDPEGQFQVWSSEGFDDFIVKEDPETRRE